MMRKTGVYLICTVCLLSSVFAQNKIVAPPFLLTKLCEDEDCRTPLANEPYDLIRNNVAADGGITDSKGRIFTSKHSMGEREDWIVRLSNGVEYAVMITPNGNLKTFVLYSYDYATRSLYDRNFYLLEEQFDVLQKPYCWLELYSPNGAEDEGQDFNNTDYKLYCGDTCIGSGMFDSTNIIYLDSSKNVQLNKPLRLTLGDGTAFNIVWSRKPDTAMLKNGEKDVVSVSYADNMPAPPDSSAFNFGRPLLHAGVSYGLTPVEKQKKDTKEEAARDSTTAAIINHDKAAYQKGENRLSSAGDIAPEGKFPDDFTGTFGVHAHPASSVITGLCKDVLNPAYKLGQPAFKIYPAKDSGYLWKGLVSGTVHPADIDTAQRESGYFGMVNYDRNVQIMVVNLDSLPDESLKEYSDMLHLGFEPDLADLKKVHYFLSWTASDSAGAAVLLIPLVRLSKE